MYSTIKGLVIFAIMAIISASWWPSHRFFKWLRKKHQTTLITVLAIFSCAALTALLVVLGYVFGQHVSDPSIRSLGSEAAGSTSTVNLFWFPFALLGLGVWAGFMSGYLKMKIIDLTK